MNETRRRTYDVINVETGKFVDTVDANNRKEAAAKAKERDTVGRVFRIARSAKHDPYIRARRIKAAKAAAPTKAKIQTPRKKG